MTAFRIEDATRPEDAPPFFFTVKRAYDNEDRPYPSWNSEPKNAMHFARKEDAQALANWLMPSYPVRIKPVTKPRKAKKS